MRKLTITKWIFSWFDWDNNIKTDAEVNPGNSWWWAFVWTTFVWIPSFLISEDTWKISYIISRDTIRGWFYDILDFNPRANYNITDFSEINLLLSWHNIHYESAFPRLIDTFLWIEDNSSDYYWVIEKSLEVINIKSDSPLAYEYLGLAYEWLEKYDTALQFYDISKSLWRNTNELNLSYARIYIAKEEYSIAKDYLDDIIEESEDTNYLSKAHINLGIIYVLVFDSNKAENHFRKAIMFNPDNKELVSVLNEYLETDLYKWDQVCKDTFWENSYYTSEISDAWLYICNCFDWYDYSEDDICIEQ